jgi:hypothetical protein
MASRLAIVVTWTRFQLLHALAMANRGRECEAVRVLANQVRGLDQSLGVFAPKEARGIIRKSGAKFRESVWRTAAFSAAQPAAKAAGLPLAAFFAWVMERLPMPERGRSVKVPPVIGDEMVQEFRATLAEVAA